MAHLVLQLSMLPVWEEHEASWFWFLLYSGIFQLLGKSKGICVVLYNLIIAENFSKWKSPLELVISICSSFLTFGSITLKFGFLCVNIAGSSIFSSCYWCLS